MSERYAPLRAQTLPARPPHPFDGDPEHGKDWRGNYVRCTCGMPPGHRLHDAKAIADVAAKVQEALAEERRRLGEVD